MGGHLQISDARRQHIRAMHNRGCSIEEIAADLGVKPKSVKSYLSALRKLGDIPYNLGRPPRIDYHSVVDIGGPLACFESIEPLKQQCEDLLKAMQDAGLREPASYTFKSQTKGPFA